MPVADLNKKDREILSATTPVTEFLEAQEKEQLNQTTQYILGKPLEECTVDEQNQAYAINILMTDAMTYSEMFDTKLTNDGGIRDGWNQAKEMIDILGISRSDVEEARTKQTEMISALTEAINGEGDKTFEEVWLEQTGVNFDINKLKKYEEDKSIYEFAQYGVQTAADFTQKLQKQPTTPQEILDLYNQYYQDENLANEKFCEMISDSFATCAASDYYPGRVENVRLGEDNQLYITYPGCEEYCFGNPADLDINNGMFTARLNRNYDTKYIEEYKTNFEQATGFSCDKLAENYANSKQSAIGEGDKFQNTVEKYCQSQQDFTKKAGSLLQTGGLIVTATGGIICLTTGITGIGAGVGAGIMDAGTKMSITGMYLDNGLEALDILTSDKTMEEKMTGLSEEAKAALIDTAFFALGMKINGAANSFSNFTTNEFMTATGLAEDALATKGVEILSEAGADFTMSIATNYITRGELDLKGEGLQQLREVLTGIARGKVNTMKSNTMDTANKLFEEGQYNEAVKTLEDSGLFSNREIARITGTDSSWLTGKKSGANTYDNASQSSSKYILATTGTELQAGYGYGINTNAKIQLGEATIDLSEPDIQSKLQNLREGEKLDIGRGSSNDIDVEKYRNGNTNTVSRNHMSIAKIDGQYVIVDNGSLNGTRIINEGSTHLRANIPATEAPNFQIYQHTVMFSNQEYEPLSKGEILNPNKNYKIPEGTKIEIGQTELDLDSLNIKQGETVTIGRASAGRANIQINDNKISGEHLKITKTESGYIVEDLGSTNGTKIAFSPLVLEHKDGTKSAYKNISGETYKALFGTDSGYVVSNSRQQSNGDCYFLSTFNALYDNPASRGRILECFRETSDGKVMVSLPNGKMEFDLNKVTDEINKNPRQYSATMPGLQVLEYVYGVEKYAKANFIQKAAFKVDELIDSFRNGTHSDEIDEHVRYRGNGGLSGEVMSWFGYKSKEIILTSSMVSELENVSNWDENVYTIGTKNSILNGGDKHFWDRHKDLAKSHMYQLKPGMENGKIVVDIINPWHSNEISCTLSLEEMKSLHCFDYLSVTKVK